MAIQDARSQIRQMTTVGPAGKDRYTRKLLEAIRLYQVRYLFLLTLALLCLAGRAIHRKVADALPH